MMNGLSRFIRGDVVTEQLCERDAVIIANPLLNDAELVFQITLFNAEIGQDLLLFPTDF
ncbi:MAG: hypothetical protein KDA78_03770 [Planctomycetaceae bacterium]|nr:hypothetical protein [Planctomycetaceae bacterium]